MATLAGQTIAATFGSLLKVETNAPNLAAGSSCERVVLSPDVDATDRTALYVSQNRLGIGSAAPPCMLTVGATSGDDENIIRIEAASGGDVQKVNTYYNALLIAGGSPNANHTSQIKLGDNYQGTYSREWTIANGWSAASSSIGAVAHGKLTFSHGGAVNKDSFDASQSGNSTLLTLDGHGGYIGINQVAPSSKLTIKGGSNNGIIITDSSGNNNVYLQPNGGQSGGELQLLNTAGTATIALSSTGQSSLANFNAGKVAIGVASGSAKLDVACPHADVDRGIHTVVSGARTAHSYGHILDNTATTSTAGRYKYGMYITSSGSWAGSGSKNYGLRVVVAGGATDYAATFEGANVGIGTDVPGYPLEVVGGGDGTYVAFFDNSGTGATAHGISISAGDADHGDSDTHYIQFMEQDSGGVGELDSDGGTLALSDTSDERLKKDIVDTATKGLEIVNGARVVDFKWRKNDHPVECGLIAQELQKVLPRAVKEGDDEDKTLRIRKTDFITILVKAVQELSAKVTALEGEDSSSDTKIAALEAKDAEYATTITALTARITALESA